MSNGIKTSRSEMIDAATAIIDEGGEAALTARSVADRLNISTQPIYREFGDMGELRAAAEKRGFEIFAEYLDGTALDQSVRYVRFATEHRRLFDFLFRGRNIEYESLEDMSHRLVDGPDIIGKLEKITGVGGENIYRLHLFEWMALHGLATMAADNRLPLSDEDIRSFTVELNRALTDHFAKKEQ